MNSSNWEDIDLIDINNFMNDVDLENIQEPFSFLKVQNPSSIFAGGDFSLPSTTCQEKEGPESECSRKRGRAESCGKTESKACREKRRRNKMNERFAELCATLEPGKTVKSDNKLVILGDAIRVLNQLKSEVVEYKDLNQKLSEEIQTLRADKNELREEKLKLKADKEKIEQKIRTLPVPSSGFMAPPPPHHHPLGYHNEPNKIPVFSGYNFVPMLHYLPQSTRDTSRDHEFRPPAA